MYSKSNKKEVQNEITKGIKNISSNLMTDIYQGIIGIEFINKKERVKLFPAVLELFKHPDRWCKKMALRGFAAINNRKGRDLIIDLLNDPETRKGKGAHSLQEVAIISLGKYYDKKAFNYLKRLFTINFPRESFKEKRKLAILKSFAEMAIYYDDALNALKYYSEIEEYKDFCNEELVYISEEREYLKSG